MLYRTPENLKINGYLNTDIKISGDSIDNLFRAIYMGTNLNNIEDSQMQNLLNAIITEKVSQM